MFFELVSLCLAFNHAHNLSLNFGSAHLSRTGLLFSLTRSSQSNSIIAISNLRISRSWNHFMFSSHSFEGHLIDLSHLEFHDFLTKPFLLSSYNDNYANASFESLLGGDTSSTNFNNVRNKPVGNLSVYNCTFEKCKDCLSDPLNDLYNCGGAFFIRCNVVTNDQPSLILFNKTKFINCSTFYRGGAVYISGQRNSNNVVNFVDCEFNNCSVGHLQKLNDAAHLTGGYGGAVAIIIIKKIEIKNSIFINSSWKLDGSNERNSYRHSLFLGGCVEIRLDSITFETSDFWNRTNFNSSSRNDSSLFDVGIDVESGPTIKMYLTFVCFSSRNLSSAFFYLNKVNEKMPGISKISNCHFSKNFTGNQLLLFNINLSSFPLVYTEFLIVNSTISYCGYEQTPMFTQSIGFTKSIEFTLSISFTHSSDFTQSSQFTESLPFSPTQISQTNAFTIQVNPQSIAEKKLSTGAIVGIAIACAALIAIIAALLFIFCRPKRRAFRPPKADPTNIDGFDVPIEM